MAKNDFLGGAIIPNNPEPSDSKYLELLVEEIYSTKDIDLKTDLTQDQINAVAKMDSFADFFEIPMLKAFGDKFLRLQVSKDRQSRKEFTQIASTATNPQPEEASTFNKLIGKQ